MTPAPNADQVKAGVADAFDFWLSQHPISFLENVQDAVKEAMTEWLKRGGDDTVHDAVKEATTEWLNLHGDDILTSKEPDQ
jgi:hypothetical protein